MKNYFKCNLLQIILFFITSHILVFKIIYPMGPSHYEPRHSSFLQERVSGSSLGSNFPLMSEAQNPLNPTFSLNPIQHKPELPPVQINYFFDHPTLFINRPEKNDYNILFQQARSLLNFKDRLKFTEIYSTLLLKQHPIIDMSLDVSLVYFITRAINQPNYADPLVNGGEPSGKLTGNFWEIFYVSNYPEYNIALWLKHLQGILKTFIFRYGKEFLKKQFPQLETLLLLLIESSIGSGIELAGDIMIRRIASGDWGNIDWDYIFFYLASVQINILTQSITKPVADFLSAVTIDLLYSLLTFLGVTYLPLSVASVLYFISRTGYSYLINQLQNPIKFWGLIPFHSPSNEHPGNFCQYKPNYWYATGPFNCHVGERVLGSGNGEKLCHISNSTCLFCEISEIQTLPTIQEEKPTYLCQNFNKLKQGIILVILSSLIPFYKMTNYGIGAILKGIFVWKILFQNYRVHSQTHRNMNPLDSIVIQN